MSLDDLVSPSGPSRYRASKRTRAEELRKRLAEEIIRGDRAPGSPLDETVLASKFSVSRTPVREALRLLAASGLVDHRAHRGAVVARPSVTQFDDMLEAMVELDSMCAGLAALRMGETARQKLAAIIDDMHRLSQTGDLGRFLKANDAFQRAIIDGACNAHLADMARATAARLQPFQRNKTPGIDCFSNGLAEHDRIVEAILRRDRRAAEDAMRFHARHMKSGYELPPPQR